MNRNYRRTLMLGIVALAACTQNPVGRPCFIGSDAGTTNQTVIASPALECQSRTCLHIPTADKNAADLCTASCSDSSDCDGVADTPCKTGFTCTIPPASTDGPFCCKKLCVCRDYLDLPDGGSPVMPAACDPSDPNNECRNIR